jgi:dephospho-CoA kinase
LFEAGQDALCDRVLVIDVPEEVQLNRTMGRDNNNEAQVRRIIATQSSREQRLQKATDVIDNSRGLEQLDAPIKQLHQQYLLMAREKNKANREQ